jgi:hypothetical protein
MPSMTDVRKQIITGVVPPQVDEALIRETWPSIAGSPLAGLADKLQRTVILGPIGWLLLLPPFLLRVAPGLARRYTLTNRRLMIRGGLKPTPKESVDLAEIDDVRLQDGSYHDFYRAGNLEVVSNGKVVMTLTAVPGPEAFRHAVLQACSAWVPGKSVPTIPPVPPAKAN